MSKDSQSSNLRLLGSPVNLSYRGKKKDERKNVRNRPRSAMQNTGYTSEYQERHRRPFSADSKEHLPLTKSFLKTFNVELNTMNNATNSVKYVPPTADLLKDKSCNVKTDNCDRDHCSNASDHGSEDTYISLGTKIKARAQSPKAKTSNCKNFLKYRNTLRKNKKVVETANDSKVNANMYGLEVKIIEKRDNSPSRNKNVYHERSQSPSLTSKSYNTFFVPLEENRKNENPLSGRVSFGNGALHNEVEQAIDSYTRRLTLTKQQLSLVEEESTQDIESVPSQNASSLSPEHSLEDNVNRAKGDDTGRDTYILDKPESSNAKDNHSLRTYKSFYDDFQSHSLPLQKMSSTIITDASSKDSGYTDSGTADERSYSRRSPYTLTNNTSYLKTSDKINKEPKSLDCVPLNTSKDFMKTFQSDKKSWDEPLNHSRLLYKDFFLKKEGHIALAPQNSPNSQTGQDVAGPSNPKTTKCEENLGYPTYLLNSNTKAYTSKVIEDYKKEIAAIDNLHELTLKDLKTDAISPTPFNIDKMFDQNSSSLEDKRESSEHSQSASSAGLNIEPEITQTASRPDVANVSTKELIENYLKVKDNDQTKDPFRKNLKKFEKKVTNLISKSEDILNGRETWNNKNAKTVNCKSNLPVSYNNKTVNNFVSSANKIPLSARIDSVQNDKDIESWMSLSAPSPNILEIVEINESPRTEPSKIDIKATENKSEIKENADAVKTKDPENVKPQELSAQSTVLDIYMMLKEIESYGDNPVVKPADSNLEDKVKTDQEPKQQDEKRSPSPKDNFLEIFQFLEKVEQSANDAMSVVTSGTPQSIPKLEVLLKLPQTELAQRLVTSSLQLEERSCCIALLQESLANHKEQMVNKVSNLEKQSMRNIARVKSECEEAIKRHQTFIDQLINDKKTLNHRIEQLVDERRTLEERWRRSAAALEDRYKIDLKNQHDKMAAAQQVARQRWVRQKAEKIKELTVKGLEGELREMAERQQKEVADLKMSHAEYVARLQTKQNAELEEQRRIMEEEKEAALLKERQMGSARLEKQILELESSFSEQRARLLAELRGEGQRAADALTRRENDLRTDMQKWKEDQEKLLEEKRSQVDAEIAQQREKIEQEMLETRKKLEAEFEVHKQEYDLEQKGLMKKKVTEIEAKHKLERDREIEKAIESLEAEAQAGRKELMDALRRNKEQYEAELKELAETEAATSRRYKDAQARFRDAEDRCAELEVTVSQLETRNKVLTEKVCQLETRSSEIAASCEEQWRVKVADGERELEQIKKTHDEQMHQLYAKVKVAVARKDSAIQALTRESAKYQEKVTLLEQKLQQQRKDFLKQK